jgi:DNA-directed RNA polymerase subunit M/transcription elongation factor TFIIS
MLLCTAPKARSSDRTRANNTAVCPNCSNMLRVSKVPPGDPNDAPYEGQNRFECLTCPYQYIIQHRYFERKTLPMKKVDDVIGGENAWANVDKTKSMFPLPSCSSRPPTVGTESTT